MGTSLRKDETGTVVRPYTVRCILPLNRENHQIARSMLAIFSNFLKLSTWHLHPLTAVTDQRCGGERGAVHCTSTSNSLHNYYWPFSGEQSCWVAESRLSFQRISPLLCHTRTHTFDCCDQTAHLQTVFRENLQVSYEKGIWENKDDQ